jgi:hypothetical protein
MKGWMTGMPIVVLPVIGAAHCLGYRSVATAQNQAGTPEAPATIPVTHGALQQWCIHRRFAGATQL